VHCIWSVRGIVIVYAIVYKILFDDTLTLMMQFFTLSIVLALVCLASYVCHRRRVCLTFACSCIASTPWSPQRWNVWVYAWFWEKCFCACHHISVDFCSDHRDTTSKFCQPEGASWTASYRISVRSFSEDERRTYLWADSRVPAARRSSWRSAKPGSSENDKFVFYFFAIKKVSRLIDQAFLQ